MSVLDDLAGGIMATKQAKATGLTPVGVESAPIKPSLMGRTGLNFPFDEGDLMAQSVVNGLKYLAQAQHELEFVREGLTKLAALYGLNADAPEEPITMKPRTTDRTDRPVIGGTGTDPDKFTAALTKISGSEFAADYAAKSAAAQAATFRDEESPEEYLKPKAHVDQWHCTEHGRDH